MIQALYSTADFHIYSFYQFQKYPFSHVNVCRSIAIVYPMPTLLTIHFTVSILFIQYNVSMFAVYVWQN